MDREKVI